MALDIQNNNVENIGTTPVIVLQTNSTKKNTVIGLSLTNVSNTVVNASVILEDAANVSAYYLKNTIIATGTSLRLVSTGEKLILSPNNKLYVQSSSPDSLDVIVSYVG